MYVLIIKFEIEMFTGQDSADIETRLVCNIDLYVWEIHHPGIQKGIGFE